MSLTQTDLIKNKEEFISLLSSVKRQGMDELITWLDEKTDFFIAPGSTAYHMACDGGLCRHSLNVYKAMKMLFGTFKPLALPNKQFNEISDDTMIVCALLHDVCKVNFYKKVTKMWKDDGVAYGSQWKSYYGYSCEDTLPLGHGEKSVILIQNFIKLTCTEMIAIRWHMGNADSGVYMSPYERPALQTANNECPLAVLLQTADYAATYLMEEQTDLRKDNALN